MSRQGGHLSAFQRLGHGGHVDLNLTSGGRVCLLVNSSGPLADVLADLDQVRAELQRLLDRDGATADRYAVVTALPHDTSTAVRHGGTTGPQSAVSTAGRLDGMTA